MQTMIDSGRPVRSDISTFSEKLLDWYDQFGRKDLPWQQHADPYRIWISEIMLQQTQVNTVIPYYQRFMLCFPDIHSLASASIDEVLALWTGLGYYARAHHCHQAAQRIVTIYQGQFPRQFDTLLSLPGIGRSTAGAIMALAWHQPYPILDGNVKRVLTRYFALAGWPGKKTVENQLWALAEQLLPATRIANYIQAQMDLGATVCLRHNPHCHSCPLHASCQAFLTDSAHLFPTPRPKKVIPEKKVHWLIAISDRQKVLLTQRPSTGIWGGLWAFPEFNCQKDVSHFIDTHFPDATASMTAQPAFQHVFTHFKLTIFPHLVACPPPIQALPGNNPLRWYKIAQALQLGLPAPVKAFLQSIE